jgi:hypothetical protein
MLEKRGGSNSAATAGVRPSSGPIQPALFKRQETWYNLLVQVAKTDAPMVPLSPIVRLVPDECRFRQWWLLSETPFRRMIVFSNPHRA